MRSETKYCHLLLAKVDVYVEQVARKVAAYLADVLEDQREKLLENLQANGMDLATYLTRFQWDMAKYPIKQSLRSLVDTISKYRYLVSVYVMAPLFARQASVSDRD